MSKLPDLTAFANLPGLELVDVRRIGLPVFIAHLDVLTEERKEVHLVSEYVLRLISAGVTSATEVEALLGISPFAVKASLADLIRAGMIDGDESSLSLTADGRMLLAGQGTTVCQESVWYVPIDGILGVPFAWPRHRLMTGAELRDFGHGWELGPFGERPKLDDLSVAAVISTVSELRPGQIVERLVSIRSLRRATLKFVPAVLLGHEGRSGPQVSFLIDGRLHQRHGEVFAERGGLKRPSFSKLGRRAPEQSQARAVARRRLTRSDSTRTGRTLEGRLSLPGRRGDAGEVRVPAVFELDGLLERSISSAKTALTVTSQGISVGFVRGLLPLVEKRVSDGLRVRIGLPAKVIEEAHKSASVSKLVQEIRLMEARFDNLQVFVVPDDLPCHLVVDNTFLCVGDYEWLSDEGSAERELRYKWALLTDVPELVMRESDWLASKLRRARVAEQGSESYFLGL